MQDEILVARMVSDLFVAPRVMTFPFEKEAPEDALASIQQIHQLLDGYIAKFEAKVGQKERFYGQLLISWKLSCRRAIQAIDDAIENEKRDREAYRRFELLESSDIISARDVLPEILTKFRLEAYPAVEALTDLLPDDNPIHREAEILLVEARKLLLNRVCGGSDPTQTPGWDLAL